MPRFVVLEHDYPDVHWDLMLEIDSAPESEYTLATWSLPPQSLPLREFRCSVSRLPIHRKRYLDYEGEISNGRGSVHQIDAGTFERLDERRFRLCGEVFNGIVEFFSDSNSELCRFHPHEQ